MADKYRQSLNRPHVNLHLTDKTECLQEPLTTFAALLHAAQSADIDPPAVSEKYGANLGPEWSVNERRLRNRLSCRKTRLKRKLQQHALELVARDRRERHGYLTQLRLALDSDSTHHHELFREFVAKNLHYALIDSKYSGWVRKEEELKGARYGMEFKSYGGVERFDLKKLKRTRRESEEEASSARQVEIQSPQASLFEQWRPIVDGLQNIDLQLHRMDEKELAAGVFERHCHWKFVAVSVANLNRVGELTAIQVSGITRLRFDGRLVQDVSIRSVRREDKEVAFDFNVSGSLTTGACKADHCVCHCTWR